MTIEHNCKAPRKLSCHPSSPDYAPAAITNKIDKVYVNDVHIPNCFAYDISAGWAFSKNPVTKSWEPKVFGTVKVTLK